MKWNIKTHVKKATKKMCTICSYEAETQWCIRSHFLRYHSGISISCYCPVCAISCSTKESLVTHIKTHLKFPIDEAKSSSQTNDSARKVRKPKIILDLTLSQYKLKQTTYLIKYVGRLSSRFNIL